MEVYSRQSPTHVHVRICSEISCTSSNAWRGEEVGVRGVGESWAPLVAVRSVAHAHLGDALLAHRLARVEGGGGDVAVVLEDEERLLAADDDELACGGGGGGGGEGERGGGRWQGRRGGRGWRERGNGGARRTILGPHDLLGGDVDAAHHPALLPVEEEGDLARAHAEERAAVQLLGGERRLERARLLKVAEELDRRRVLAHLEGDWAGAAAGGASGGAGEGGARRRAVDGRRGTSAYSPESSAQTKSRAFPNDFLRHASAV